VGVQQRGCSLELTFSIPEDREGVTQDALPRLKFTVNG
jgi:hypothetical protein